MRKKLKCSIFQLSQRISKPKVPSNWNVHFLNYFLYEFLCPVLLKGEGDTIWSCYLIKWIKQYWVIWSCIFFLFSSVQSLSHVQLVATLWIAACQASLSITNSRSLLKHMSIKSVMPSSHLVLHHPLLLLPPILPSFRVFSSESALHMKCPKYWSLSFSISPSNEYLGLISFRIEWLDLPEVKGTLVSSPTPQFKSINSSAF